MQQNPVVLIGDEDWDSANRLSGQLGDQLYLLHARNSGAVVRYAKKFKPDIILLCESIRYGRRGAEGLLPILTKETGASLIVLTEASEAPFRSRWIELGASDCMPHPTKYSKRIAGLSRRINDLMAGKRPGQ